MPFDQRETERLLAATGRRCCICGSLHNIQVHHITPKERGGTDDIENAIPLCPSCHDRVHVKFSKGRTTRDYTPEELRLHRDNMISRFDGQFRSGNRESFSPSEDCLKVNNKVRRPIIIENIFYSQNFKKDCTEFKIKIDDAMEYVRGEAKRHPLMFESAFTSLPLIFGEMILLLSWDTTSARLERLLTRQEAYPLNDKWTSCLGFYRKAMLLSYRTHGTDRLTTPSEQKQTLSIFKMLLGELREYAKILKRQTATVLVNLSDLEQLYDEAEFALLNGNTGTAIARLEALLSITHKVIISYAPQGKVRPTTAPAVPASSPADPAKISLLIVEDDPILRASLQLLLQGEGFQCYIASDSRTAMQLLVDRDFDIIMTDIMMPNTDDSLASTDGRELVLAAKNSGSRAKIVVHSVFTETANRAQIGTDKFPCDVYVPKGTAPRELIGKLKELSRQIKSGMSNV